MLEETHERHTQRMNESEVHEPPSEEAGRKAIKGIFVRSMIPVSST